MLDHPLPQKPPTLQNWSYVFVGEFHLFQNADDLGNIFFAYGLIALIHQTTRVESFIHRHACIFVVHILKLRFENGEVI